MNPIKKVCENKNFCSVARPYENTNILDFNQHQKSDKTTFIIYEYLESLIEKIDGGINNCKKSSTTNVAEHTPRGFSISTRSSFKETENKHDEYRGRDCMKKFFESLREIFHFKNKKMKLLTKE